MARVRVFVTLKPSLLDSAGRTVADSLNKLGYSEIESARIGKVIELEVSTFDPARIEEMARRVLANPVIENFRYELIEEPVTAQ